MTNTNPAAPARRSLIVSTPATRRAYDAGVKAAAAGKEEYAALNAWDARNYAAEWFDGDALDAWQAGFSDTPAPVTTHVAAPGESARTAAPVTVWNHDFSGHSNRPDECRICKRARDGHGSPAPVCAHLSPYTVASGAVKCWDCADTLTPAPVVTFAPMYPLVSEPVAAWAAWSESHPALFADDVYPAIDGDELAAQFGGSLPRTSVVGETSIWDKVSA